MSKKRRYECGHVIRNNSEKCAKCEAKMKALRKERAAKKSVHVGFHAPRTRRRIHAFKKHTRHTAYIKGRVAFYAWDRNRTVPVNPFRAIVLRGDWTTGFLDAQNYYEGRDKVRDNKKLYSIKNLEREFLNSISEQEDFEPPSATRQRVEEEMEKVMIERFTQEIIDSEENSNEVEAGNAA